MSTLTVAREVGAGAVAWTRAHPIKVVITIVFVGMLHRFGGLLLDVLLEWWL